MVTRLGWRDGSSQHVDASATSRSRYASGRPAYAGGTAWAPRKLACTLFGLSPAEALLGATRHGARALGLADRGALAPGLRGDLALWNLETPAELCGRVAVPSLATRVVAGAVHHAQTR